MGIKKRKADFELLKRYLDGEGWSSGQDPDGVEDALAAQITGVHAHIVTQLFSRKYDLDFTLGVQGGS